jgi:hypothetical protein
VLVSFPQTIVNPVTGYSLGSLYDETRAGSFTIYVYDSGLNQWSETAKTASYLWAIQATSFDIYNSIIGAVDTIRGHSIRWWLWADVALTS